MTLLLLAVSAHKLGGCVTIEVNATFECGACAIFAKGRAVCSERPKKFSIAFAVLSNCSSPRIGPNT